MMTRPVRTIAVLLFAFFATLAEAQNPPSTPPGAQSRAATRESRVPAESKHDRRADATDQDRADGRKARREHRKQIRQRLRHHR